MKIIFIQGGLGNQLFQYAFYKYMLKKEGVGVYLDATAPFISKHGGFELKRIFPEVAKDKRILPYWKVRPFFLASDVLKKVCRINLHADIENPSGKKIWWKAHWQEYGYPEYVKEELFNDLQFIPITDEQNRQTREQILASNAVSLHVRRGDYLKPHVAPTFTEICTPAYYSKAIEYISHKVKQPLFFVFSDDIQWVKENLPLDNAVYVNWNIRSNSFRDMQLMSLCKHHIIANSTFSWWGAWLNRQDCKTVICPARWAYGFPAGFEDKLFPPEWHRIET
jgi:hypothetical protein